MEQRLARIGNVLKDVSSQDWKVRVEALREMRSCLGSVTLLQLKPLVGNLVKQMCDGRSLVMQEACETARSVSMAFGTDPDFSAVADAFVKACLPIVPSSTKVMSDAAKNCLQQIVQGTPRGYQTPLDRFIKGCTDTTRAASFRLECVRLVDLCMNEWDAEWLSRGDNIENIEVAVRKSLRDADPEVRTAARMAFTTFAGLFPDQARKSFKELEPEDKQRFSDLFPPAISAPPTSSLLSSAVKRTPHHSAVKRVAPSTATGPVPFSANARQQPLSSRKPLQSVSMNTAAATPAPKSALKEKTVTFTGGLGGGAVTTTTKKTASKPARTSVQDRISRSIIDCFGAEDTAAAKSRRFAAMRELAFVFMNHAAELSVADFASCIHAIESCVNSLDESVSASGLDAFGIFIHKVGESSDSRDVDLVRLDMLRTAFPIALKRANQGLAVVDKAADLAINSCFEHIAHTDLLATVVNFQKAYRDDSILSTFIAHQQNWEKMMSAESHGEDEDDNGFVLAQEAAEEDEGMSDDEIRILELAKQLSDGDAEVRRNAVDALVNFRRRESAEINHVLESSLSGPQLKLLDCFMRRACTAAN